MTRLFITRQSQNPRKRDYSQVEHGAPYCQAFGNAWICCKLSLMVFSSEPSPSQPDSWQTPGTRQKSERIRKLRMINGLRWIVGPGSGWGHAYSIARLGLVNVSAFRVHSQQMCICVFEQDYVNAIHLRSVLRDPYLYGSHKKTRRNSTHPCRVNYTAVQKRSGMWLYRFFHIAIQISKAMYWC